MSHIFPDERAEIDRYFLADSLPTGLVSVISPKILLKKLRIIAQEYLGNLA
ncbi:MAG: hypothetical protein HC916_17120 [Coleofasciculaceae cyanobacterium SM2_1_6]|nr:hypothetical protein [Coleofasciculaceae cyanobacterium SM2_1_6]